MIVAASPAVAFASHTTSVEPIGERLVTTGFAAYAAAGDRVLYQPKGAASTLKLYDLKSRTERTIEVQGKVLSLALSDTHAAYTTVESVRGQDRYNLWLHDLQTDQRVSASEGVWEMPDPRLAGGKLLWRTGGALTVLDIAAKGLTTLPSYSQFLEFDGHFAVQTYGDELVVTDVATRNEERHTLPVPARAYGDLSYGRLLYVGNTCEYNQEPVYLYNLVTRQQREIGKQACGGPAPALLGNVAGLINNEVSPTGYNPSAVKVVQLETGRSAEPMMDMDTKSDPRLTGNYIIYTEGERLVSVALNLQYPMSDSIGPVYHTVAAGESLWQIARANRVRLPDLVHANNLLRPDAIDPGARLLLPNPVSPRYDSYTVQSGDTLFRLAARFSTTVRSIAAVNHLENPDSLLVGQVLQIARGPEEAGDAEWIAQSYAVAPGDTLWQIAQRAGVSIQALVAQNGLTNPDQIHAGTQLVIRPRAWYRYQ